MTAVWYRFRASFRRRVASYVGVALLLGLLGGVALGSVAGARRTASAFPRFRHSTNPSDIQVNSGRDPELVERTSHLPGVTRSATYLAFDAGPLRSDQMFLDPSFLEMEIVGSLDGLYFTQDRFTPTQGRLPDPAREDEIAVNAAAAKRHDLRVGQRLEIGVWDPQTEGDDFFDAMPPPASRFTVTLVGIGLFNDEVLQDEADRSWRMLFTPAFTQRNRAYATYSWTGVRLERRDVGVAGFKHDYLAGLPEDSPEFFRVNSTITAQAQRAGRPLAVALGLFGVLAGIAALLLVGQAIVRLLAADRDDLGVLRASGAGPWLTSSTGLPGITISVVGGLALAGVVAFVLSWVTPIGPVRHVEVHPGPALDWTVIGLGTAVFLVVLGLVTIVVGIRQAPHREAARAVAHPRRPSGTVAAAARAGLPASAVTGMRLALERGEGRTAMSVRAAMGGAVVGVVVVVAALVFGASLQSLVHHPRLYGWNWDFTVMDGAGYGNIDRARAHERLDHNPDVAAWSGAYFGSLELDGHNVAALGVDPNAAVFPPVLTGHLVRAPDEVVLGPTTLAALGKRVGDTVVLGRGEHLEQLRIAGSAVLPTVGINHGAYTSLGVGAVLPFDKLPGYARNAEFVGGTPGPTALFVRLRPGRDRAEASSRLATQIGDLGQYPGSAQVLSPQRPADIVNYVDMGATPALLAGGLALAVVMSLGVTLAAGVRRRRRDLALLKSLGLTRGQLSATVAWQAAITMIMGFAVGLPLGIIVGRWLWLLFAHQLAVVAVPSVPIVQLAALGGGLLVLAELVAAVPARAAGRTRVATTLRSE